MGNTFFFRWEISVIEFLQSHFVISNTMSQLLAFLGNEAVMILFFGLFYWSLDKEAGKRIGAGMFIGILFPSIVKNIVMRRRPYMDNGNIFCKVEAVKGDLNDPLVQGFSFPSMHASDSIISFGRLTEQKNGFLKLIGVLLPLIIGISRLYLGVHYPTDVLAGWVIGIVSVTLGNILYDRIADKKTVFSLILIAGLPGWFFSKSNDFFSSYGIVLGLSLGFLFEKKHVGFSNTKNIIRIVLRPVLGLLVFSLLQILLKICVPESLAAGKFATHIIRTLRYSLSAFVTAGIYPMMFSVTDKLFYRREPSKPLHES